MADEILDTQETEVSTEVSMDDTIRQALSEIESRDEVKEDRVRDEQGRFSKKAEDAPVEEKVEPEPVTIPPEIQRLGLKKEEAEAFAQAPEAVRQAFLRRSDEMHKGIEQYRTKAQFAETMEKAIAPYQNFFHSAGITPDIAFTKLMQADQTLRNGTPEQKQQMLARLAQDYGIQPSGETPDPNFSHLQTEIQQLRGWIEQKSQQEQEREQATLNSEIAKFSSDPANSHFESVKTEMAALLQSGQAEGLKDAYEKACWLNPSVRTQILAKQQEEAEAKRKADADQRAKEAKKAAAVNVRKNGALPPKAATGSMDDTIRETAERLGIM